MGAVYAINPCSEATVRELLKRIDPAPVQQYDIDRVKALPSPIPHVDAVEASHPDPDDPGNDEDDEENWQEPQT